MHHYRAAIGVSLKPDDSPVTVADLESHSTICRLLGSTGLPVVSEEDPATWETKGTYWLVDPLDGTREFINHTDEFCVNVALIDGDVPAVGVVFAPALDELFVGADGVATVARRGEVEQLGLFPRTDNLRMATSRSHPSPMVQTFMSANQIAQTTPMGSALKYMRLVDGSVDVVPRFVGSSEWDTAAPQAILSQVGARIIDLGTKSPLRYGGSSRRNPWHIAFRDPYQLDEFVLPDTSQGAK
jgi:3'(2'), 5'-bisphosphate nucleotidase